MQDGGAGQGEEKGPASVPDLPQGTARSRRAAQSRPRYRGRISLTLILTLVAMALVFTYLTMAYTGKTIRLPTWAVAEIEDRMNPGLAATRLPKGTAVSLGGVEFAVDTDFVPRFRIEDIRLIESGGRSLLTLPEAMVAFEPKALLSGKVRPSSLRLVGARLAARRDVTGRIDLEFDGRGQSVGPKGFSEILTAVEALFDTPMLSALTTIEAEGLTLTLTDERAGRSWQVGDGRLEIANRASDISAELALTLLDGSTPAQALLTLVSDKGAKTARLTAKLDRMASGDLAAMSPPLAFLGFVEAPISGALSAHLAESGEFAGLTAELQLAPGKVEPGKGAEPIAFDRAALSLSYDPKTARIALSDLVVESASLRLKARGHADLLGSAGGPLVPGVLPDSILGQIAFSDVKLDPEGLFAEPVRFGQGALDLRLRLRPFKLEIGQLALVEGEERLLLSGAIAAKDGAWDGALDMDLNQIAAERLLKVWPVAAVPKTRTWFANNVGQARLYDVTAALRLRAGEQPNLSLSYEFADTEVRFVRTLPPILNARGHATLENKTYTVTLDKGHVIAPEGGRIDADGSVLQIQDVTQVPATAKLDLVTSSSLTATLSLLDQEPFSFFAKAGQPVNLGDGRAELVATLVMPMKPKVSLEEVSFVVSGRILDFTSPSLVPGRILTAPEVLVGVTTEGLELKGKGSLDLLPLDVTYRQGFGPEQKGRARINGSVLLSDAALRDLGVELPKGTITGEGLAAIDLALVKGEPPQLTLTSNLTGLGLRLDALGFSKAAKTKASLDLEARLSRQPVVERMVLKAPGLEVRGRITTRENGGLAEADFERVIAGDWLDAPVTLNGNGKGRAPDLTVSGGTIDLRNMPKAKGGPGGGGPFQLRLDRLVISKGISLTDFRGEFGVKGGLNGSFVADVNGKARVQGVVAPAKAGSALRITSDNAGAVMAAAGIFDKGRGGTLDMTLIPRGPEGEYTGKATFTRMRVQDAPALAELLSAVSVVGLLEQMNGDGLAFNNGRVDFILTPTAVEISKGSAVGASLGISFAGLYLSDGGRIDLQGVISPIYLLNGVGEILTRRGEGLFGFNYRLSGSTDNPKVSVNPLSVLTPGMFRELFRQAPPNLQDAPGASGG
jgi:hypothetical protein